MSKVIAVIAAHPDDEVLGCGGTIAKHIQAGDSVHLLILADGESSRESATENDISTRNQNLFSSVSTLGIHSLETANFPDNQFVSVPLLDITRVVESFLTKHQPEIIYTHSYYDLNIDHQCTARAVITAARPQPASKINKVLAFEVLSASEWHFSEQQKFNPNYFVDVTDFVDKKMDALQHYASEMRDDPHTRSFSNVLHLMGLRGHTVGYNAAEAFEVIYIRD